MYNSLVGMMVPAGMYRAGCTYPGYTGGHIHPGIYHPGIHQSITSSIGLFLGEEYHSFNILRLILF